MIRVAYQDRARPHQVVLYGETLDFITSAMVATVAEIGSGSTLRDTFLATEIQKSLTKPIMLNGATPAETCFTLPLRISFT